MKKTNRIRKYIPTASLVIFLVGITAILCYVTAILYTPFADFFNSTVSEWLRAVLSFLTGFLPFSLFELLLIFLLPLLVFAVVFSFFKKGAFARVHYAVSIISIASLLISTYIFTFGIAYRATPVREELGISVSGEVDTERLAATFVKIQEEVNALSRGKDGAVSEMPYSLDELSDIISDAYLTLSENYPGISGRASRVKPVVFSAVMSSMGITGIFSPFTGEANINIKSFDYSLPFTVAHEFAHQRGIAREDEANFIAHLACVSSEDEFVRYSGYLYLYEYLASALYSADKELYFELAKALSATARADILASREVSAKYSESTLGKINDKANDLYLKSNGTEGIISYNLVVLLAVEYYCG